MKSLRKSFLTLLALTLFGGAGAWAQGPTVTEITQSMIPSSWEYDNTPLSAGDLPGFVAVDSATAVQWTGFPTTGYAVLIYAFTTDGKTKHILFDNGNKSGWTNNYERYNVPMNLGMGNPVFYTTGGGAIELTPSNNNHTWTLGQTPDYDLELQVEYYEAHALKEIPAGWTVMVNGVAQQAPYQGDSLMIVETDSVTLVPAGNPRRVKKVMLIDEPVYYTIPAIQGEPEMTINVAGCTTWQQIVDRNPGKFEISGNGQIYSIHVFQDLLDSNNQNVLTSTLFDPSQNYHWHEGQH